MIYLLLSIVFATSLYVIFRVFPSFKIHTSNAIVFNYLTAAIFSCIISGVPDNLNTGWIGLAVFIGLLFVSTFNIMGATTRNAGVTVAAVASKMSMVIPVVAAYFFYGDEFNAVKITGIVIALAAVIFTSYKPQESDVKKSTLVFLLPLLLFVGTGLVDSSLKYAQHFKVEETEHENFITFLFFTAFSGGLIALMIKIFSGRNDLKKQDVLGGIVLGIPNYFSLFFLIKALSFRHFESSVIFPVNNLGIVALSAVTGFLFFRERFTKLNKLGLILSFVAILLIYLSNNL